MIIEANSDILGRNLKHLRESKGLSLAEMAALIEMADYKLDWLEQGQDFEIEEHCYRNLSKYFPEEAENIFHFLLE